jgi:hypothetical protein
MLTYEMRTSIGKAALARRDAAMAARDFDQAIEDRLTELRQEDPVIRALMLLKRCATALPAELLRRGRKPVLAGPYKPVLWRAPSAE